MLEVFAILFFLLSEFLHSWIEEFFLLLMEPYHYFMSFILEFIDMARIPMWGGGQGGGKGVGSELGWKIKSNVERRSEMSIEFKAVIYQFEYTLSHSNRNGYMHILCDIFNHMLLTEHCISSCLAISIHHMMDQLV